MTQPVDDFPTGGFCLGAPSAEAAQRILARKERREFMDLVHQVVPEVSFDDALHEDTRELATLPKRIPGEYEDADEWT